MKSALVKSIDQTRTFQLLAFTDPADPMNILLSISVLH